MGQRIAVLGLGNMGLPMAANLVKAGHAVTGHDPSEGAQGAARALGLPLAASAEEAARGADAVVTMLPAGRHVLAAWEGLATAAPRGALLIDCSTIDVESARAAHALAAGAGLMSADAPVSGGVMGATEGTLTFMAGAEPAAFERAKHLLEAMGKRVVHCGGPGAGQAAKICNNMLLGISMIGTAEAFALAERLGLSHQALFDVASTSSGQCWSLTTYCPVPGPVPGSPANRNYRPGFAAALMLKDLALSQEAALAAGAATPLGAAARDLFARFVEGGDGGTDFSGVIRLLRAMADERGGGEPA